MSVLVTRWKACCRRELDIAGYVGNQGEMVTPEQCKEVYYQSLTTSQPDKEKIQRHKNCLQLLPHLNILDLLGRIYSATDGSVDPTGLTRAYARVEGETYVWPI